MLPENLKTLVRLKLRKSERAAAPERDGERLAEGWREAMRGILEWLAPMAHDTLKWKAESNIEAMKFEAKKSVLLMQTLHFSDREKVEAAIAELLVGLSYIYWYEDRRNCGDGDVDVHDSWSTCRRWSCDRIELR
ncbi:uncharacterized protein LOC127789655 [Diospyros lotus]|nr:uncharacterized protein LOC127789655 [Diospyros lotus]